MKEFLVLNSGSVFGRERVKGTYMESFDYIDIYSLPEADLAPYSCLVIGAFVDQDYLLEQRGIVRDFLDSGKVVVFCGNLVTDWLPGGKPFIPKTINSYKDYMVSVHTPHPIFEGVLEDDMTYKKGVSGFFARGHHPAPEGAEILLTLPGGEPITYIDRNSTRGTILAHVGFDLFGYMQADEETTVSRISPQLIAWVRGEYERLQQGGSAS